MFDDCGHILVECRSNREVRQTVKSGQHPGMDHSFVRIGFDQQTQVGTQTIGRMSEYGVYWVFHRYVVLA